MERYTIADALKMKWSGIHYRVYLFRRGDSVLYVGQTDNAILRVRQHTYASSKLKIGEIIRSNMPESLNWLVEIYSIEECDSLVQRYAKEEHKSYQQCQTWMPWMHAAAAIAEKAMIAYHKPLYNYPSGRKRGANE